MNVSKLTCYMVREPSHTKRFDINSEPDFQQLISDELHLDQSPMEKVYCLHLNSHCIVTGYELISQGTQTSSDASPSIIYRGAILNNAAAIVVIHNHPSGNTTPSQADIKVTEMLDKAGKLLGIELLDHLIVGHNRQYISLRTEGLFNF